MKLCLYSLSAVLLLFTLISCSVTKGQTLRPFTKSGQDWSAEGDATWKFVEDELTGNSEGTGGYLMTRDRFRNFILELEFQPDSTVNSGVFVRCKQAELSNVSCYEMNIWDLHPDQNSRTGSIVTRSAPLTLVHTVNQWNTFKIHCEGNRLKTWINGKPMADMVNSDLDEGSIALQAAEHGRIKFRNIRLKILQ